MPEDVEIPDNVGMFDQHGRMVPCMFEMTYRIPLKIPSCFKE
jgi:hypothetical protein